LVNATDNLKREILPGVYVGKFPADVPFARIEIDKDAPSAQIKGAYRVPRRLRLGVAMLLATGITAVLAAMALGQLKSAVKPGGPPPHPQLVEVQRAQAPRLTVAATIVAEPSSQTPLQVSIGSRDEVPANSFLDISGLPPAILLSAGNTIGPGEWVVPLSALPNLMMNVPADVSGRFELVITLLGGRDETRSTPTAQARAALVIAPLGASPAPAELASRAPGTEPNQSSNGAAPQPASADTRTALATAPEPPPASANAAPVEGPPPVPAAKPDPSVEEAASQPSPGDRRTALVVTRDPQHASATPAPAEEPPHPAGAVDTAPRVLRLTPEERARAEKFVARGERDLEEGNVALARPFFQRAAEAGLARGALLLAATYDPYELASKRVLGVQPNAAVARKWYERARALGAPEAEDRLARLTGD
jgi:hypothetical protein